MHMLRPVPACREFCHNCCVAGADVYSYAPDENDMVEDPLLAEHLSHWGIDVMRLEKTEKSMAELQAGRGVQALRLPKMCSPRSLEAFPEWEGAEARLRRLPPLGWADRPQQGI